MCVVCGKEPHIENSSMCFDCNYHNYLWRKERYERLTPEEKAKRNEATTAWRHKNQEQGKCRCGRKLTDKRYKMCLECRRYFNRKQKEYHPAKMWMEIGLCRWCGKETAEGTVYCAEHLQKMRELCERNFRPNGVSISNNQHWRRLSHADLQERETNQIQRESQ